MVIVSNSETGCEIASSIRLKFPYAAYIEKTTNNRGGWQTAVLTQTDREASREVLHFSWNERDRLGEDWTQLIHIPLKCVQRPSNK